MTMAVIVRHILEEEQAGLGSPGVDELRWLKPVHPGDRLTVRGTVVDKTPSRSKPHIGTIRTKTIVSNQDGVDVMTLHLDRDAAAAPASGRLGPARRTLSLVAVTTMAAGAVAVRLRRGRSGRLVLAFDPRCLDRD